MIRVARTLMAPMLAVAIGGCGLGFSPGSSHGGDGRRTSCSGDEVLEVFNPLTQNVDIYAWTDAGHPLYFTSAGPGMSTIPLTGTRFEHITAGFEPRVGSNYANDVRISRRCESRSS
jgi:hypothetical protein